MPPSTQPRIGRPLLWISIGVAAVLAFELSTAWIAYSDRQAHRGSFLNFHPLFAVVYVPLAFGLLWPILLSLAALTKHRPGQSLVWPAKTALIVFILTACCAAPLAMLEYRAYDRGLVQLRTENARAANIRNQLETAKQEALLQLQTHGVTAFSEPLTGPQTSALNSYLDTHSQSPQELEDASRHYRTSLAVMEHLSQMRNCPGPVLEIVFDNVIELQKGQLPLQSVNPYEVLYNLAWHPNTPVPVLARMLDNPYPQVREAAAANPRLPEDAKALYLKKASVSQSFAEREHAAGNPDTPPEELSKMLDDGNFKVRQNAASNPNTPKESRVAYLHKTALSDRLWDRIVAAQSPDCPPEDLRKLSLDPATAKYVAANLAAPTDLLETLANSDDPETCRRAVANLTRRQKTAR